MIFVSGNRLLGSKIWIVTLIISIFFTPVFGQTAWYDEWVGAQSKDAPNLLDDDFVVEKFVTGLSLPTTMTFVDNGILVLQKNDGKVRYVMVNGTLLPNEVLDVEVSNLYESGLLGIVYKNPFVYLYYTESIQDGEKPIANNVYKYKWINNTLQDPILVKSLPAYHEALIHNGGAMVVGKDDTVYAVIGDQNMVRGAGILQNQFAQPDDTGVILPVDPPGPYFAIGIRNSFGLAIDPLTGNMWSTENGPSSFDEVNLVMPEFNSGWNAHTGPIKESRIHVVSVPDFFGVFKSQIQIFLSSIFSLFALSEYYEYSDPEFSWEKPHAPTAINFAPSSFEKYGSWLFVGDCNFGNIYKFKLNSERNGFVFEDYSLNDLVLNENDDADEILFGKGFGCITDIEFKGNEMYVVSLVDGTIYKISTSI